MRKVRRYKELTVVQKTVLSLLMGLSVFFMPVALIGVFYLSIFTCATQNLIAVVSLFLILLVLLLVSTRNIISLLRDVYS